MDNKLNNKTGNLGVCREDREMKYNTNQIKEGDYKLLEKVIWKSKDFQLFKFKKFEHNQKWTIKQETLVSYEDENEKNKKGFRRIFVW